MFPAPLNKNPPQIPNHMAGTFHGAHSAAKTKPLVNHRTVMDHFHCLCRTGFFTDAASDTAHPADFFCGFSFVLVGTFYHNIIGTFVNMNHFLMAGFYTCSTGSTPFFIYLGCLIPIPYNGTGLTDCHTVSASHAAIFTLESGACGALSITGNHCRPVRKCFLTSHVYPSFS